MKLSLGTAQFGSRYGVANGQGQISYDEAVTVIETARLGCTDLGHSSFLWCRRTRAW